VRPRLMRLVVTRHKSRISSMIVMFGLLKSQVFCSRWRRETRFAYPMPTFLLPPVAPKEAV
jgi:hypothetical protein